MGNKKIVYQIDMLEQDEITKRFDWKCCFYTYENNILKVIREIEDLVELCPNKSIRILKNDRVLCFLKTNEQELEMFIEHNTKTNRIALFDKQYEDYKKIEQAYKSTIPREPKYEKVKVKGKVMKKSLKK